MELFQKYPLSRVSEYTGVPKETLQNWLKRGVVVGHNQDTGGGSQGRHRSFSFYTVMQFAMTKALLDAGMGSVARAAECAAQFAHVGGGGDIFDLPERMPAFPFHQKNGETLFAVGAERCTEELWSISGPRDTYGNLRYHVGKSFILINASEVFQLVCNRMGKHPYEILDEVYPDEA